MKEHGVQFRSDELELAGTLALPDSGGPFYDHADHALAAIQYLKQERNIHPEKIFLLGHSEGAFIATRLAGGGAEVAGIVLLAGGAQSSEAVLKWQAIQVARGLTGINRWLIKILRIDISKSQQKQRRGQISSRWRYQSIHIP